MIRRIASIAVVVAVAVTAACSAGTSTDTDAAPSAETTSSSTAAVAEPSERGPYGVGYTEMTFVDESRDGRELLTSIWYPIEPDAEGSPASYEVLAGFALTRDSVLGGDVPVADGVFPLVIFSHGNGGTRIQSLELTETLASYGFVVAAPDHAGNTFLEAGDVEAALKSATDRPPDISFLIDSILALDESDGVLQGAVDPDRIGVSGHSYGGFTALAIAAGTPDWPADDRVDAIAPLAPASFLVADEYLATIDIPTLLMGGTLDQTAPIEPNLSRPFEMIAADDVYRVDLIDGDHNSFTMICSAEQYLDDPGMPEEIRALAVDVLTQACAPEVVDGDTAIALTNRYVIAFFLTYLAGDDRYAEFLSPTAGVDFSARS